MAVGRDWYIDPALSNISVGYRNETYVADQVYPVVPVAKQSGRYFKFTKADWFRVPNTLRAPKTAPRTVDFGVSSEGYFCDNFMLQEHVSFEDMANADVALAILNSTTMHVTDLLLLDQENRVGSQLTSTSNFAPGHSVTLAGTQQWNDRANSDPVSDVSSGKSQIHSVTGVAPNWMVVGKQVYDALLLHPDIIDRLKYVARATEAEIGRALADIFGVQKLLVGTAIKNTADEGLGMTGAYVWGKNVVLGVSPAAPGIMTPSLGYSFRWTDPLLGTPFAVETKDDDDIRARKIRAGYYSDEVLVGSDLGFIIASAVA